MVGVAGSKVRLETLKSYVQWWTSSSKAPTPKGSKLPQTSLPPNNQVFKHMSRWGTLLIQTTTSQNSLNCGPSYGNMFLSVGGHSMTVNGFWAPEGETAER